MAKQTQTTQTSRNVALLAGAMAAGNALFAAGTSISAGEILMYIALIVGVILAAWFLSNGKSSGSKDNHNNANRPHFDHPNDPHFRRLRKKTS